MKLVWWMIFFISKLIFAAREVKDFIVFLYKFVVFKIVETYWRIKFLGVPKKFGWFSKKIDYITPAKVFYFNEVKSKDKERMLVMAGLGSFEYEEVIQGDFTSFVNCFKRGFTLQSIMVERGSTIYNFRKFFKTNQKLGPGPWNVEVEDLGKKLVASEYYHKNSDSVTQYRDLQRKTFLERKNNN